MYVLQQFSAWVISALLGTRGFGTQLIIGGIAVLVLAAFSFGIRLHYAVRQAALAVRTARTKLEAAGEAEALPAHFEALDRELRQSRVLGPAWKRFSASLLLPSEPSQPIRQTVPAEKFFDASLLRRTGLSVRFHAALPNILVGGGLFLTFVGLILALQAAAGAVGSGSGAASRHALEVLLEAASLKFMSSLFGLGLSIAYLIWHRGELHRFDAALAAFCDAVTERIPPISPLALTRDGNRLLNQQLAVQQEFVQELVLRLGDRLDTTLGQRLAEQIGPLRLAIEGMAKGMATMNQDALEKMIAGFGDLLRETAGGQLRQLADTLAGMSSRLEAFANEFPGIQGQLHAAGQGAAEEIAAAIGVATQQMEATTAAWQGQMDAVNAALAEQAAAATAAATALLPCSNSFETAAKSVEAATSDLSNLAEAQHNLAQTLERAVNAQSEAQARADDLARRLTESAGRFEGVDRELGNTIHELGAALQKFRSEITDFVTAVDDGMVHASGLLSGSIENLQDVLEAFHGNLVKVDGHGSQ